MQIPRSVLAAAALIPACAVGPDFQHPAPPGSERYTETQLPEATAVATGEGGAAQRFISGASVPPRWWELFRCDALNELVQDALAHSPTVLGAYARLREAEENLTAQTRGTRYPTIDGQLGVTRQQIDPAAFGFPNVSSEPFTLFNAQVNVAYTFDLFGGNRRLREATGAQAEYQAYEAQAAQLTLAANAVAAAIRQADLKAQIDYTEQILAAQIQQLAISEARYRAGGIALSDLQNQRTQVEQVRAALPVLEAQRQQADHQLAVYTGKPPAEAAIPRFKLRDLQLPAELPLTLPSELVRGRPDVRAAEAQWHEAAANVGVATANLFPHINISGSVGSDRTHANDLVDGANVWSIGAALMQPIFHAGELLAKKRSAVAAYDAAAQAYEGTVLESLQQVADSLRVVEADARTLQARAAASEQAGASYHIARQRFDAGGISEFSLLDAQRMQLQASLDRDHAEAQRYADTAALLHAVAGKL
jgi:NodT family efflux transporter outer membrane factor (OMF) lipoprotein